MKPFKENMKGCRASLLHPTWSPKGISKRRLTGHSEIIPSPSANDVSSAGVPLASWQLASGTQKACRDLKK